MELKIPYWIHRQLDNPDKKFRYFLIFKKMREQGYTETAFGEAYLEDSTRSHPCLGLNKRIDSLVAFYHPDGKIATLEHYAFGDNLARARRELKKIGNNLVKKEYTSIQFQKLLDKFEIILDDKKNLSDIIENYGKLIDEAKIGE